MQDYETRSISHLIVLPQPGVGQADRRVKAERSHPQSAARAAAASSTEHSVGSGTYDRCATETGHSTWRGHGPAVNDRSAAEPTGTADAIAGVVRSIRQR